MNKCILKFSIDWTKINYWGAEAGTLKFHQHISVLVLIALPYSNDQFSVKM